MSNSSILPIDRTLLGTTNPRQSGHGSDDSEGVICIPQNSSTTGASPSECLVSYPRHLLVEFYPTSEMQLTGLISLGFYLLAVYDDILQHFKCIY